MSATILGKSYVITAAALLEALQLPVTDRITEVKRSGTDVIIDVACLDTMPPHIAEGWKGK